METRFDFAALLKNPTATTATTATAARQTTGRPLQFVCVAVGVLKRLDTNLRNWRLSRRFVFDSTRNLPKLETATWTKVDHRRKQLEKWKAEKERKKKAEALRKQKPFRTGIVHTPLTFVPPPPPPKPGTLVRVTRSRTRTTNAQPTSAQSFAPRNAKFKPPHISNMVQPTLAPQLGNKAMDFNFDPVSPSQPSPNPTTRSSHPQTTQLIETSSVRKNLVTVSKSVSDTEPTTPKSCKAALNEVYNVTSEVIKFNSSDYSSDAEHSQRPETYTLRKGSIISIAFSSGNQSNDSSVEEKQLPVKNRTVRKPYRRLKRRSSAVQIVEQSVPRILRNSLKRLVTNDMSSPEEEDTLGNSSSSEQIQPEKRRSSRVPVDLISSSSGQISTDPESSIEEPSQVLSYTSNSNENVQKSPILTGSVTPKISVPISESGPEEKVISPRLVEPFSLTPEQTESLNNSPFITVSRGSKNSLEEKKRKLKLRMMMEADGLLDCQSRAESVARFRRLLARETERLAGACDSWERLAQQTALPDIVQGAVLSAVGLARLLMASKMQQFASLVERCAADRGAPPVTPADLQGFWDLVFLEVENVDIRFKELEKLRLRNWVEEASVAVAKRVVKRAARAARIAAKSASTSLKDMIAAARKAKKQEKAGSSNLFETPIKTALKAPAEKTPQSLRTPEVPTTPAENIFDAGFFTVRSPVRVHSTRATPRGDTLLQPVLSCEAHKSASRSSSFAMLRASLLAKSSECDGVSPLPMTPEVKPIDLNASPGRSILKSAGARSEPKSAKVHFKFRRGLDDSFSSLDSVETDRDTVYTQASSPTEGVEVLTLGGLEKTPGTQDVALAASGSVEASHGPVTERTQTVMTRRMHRLANTPEKAASGEKENAADAKTPETRNVALVLSSPVEASHNGATDRIQTVMTRRMHRLANTPEKADNGEKENAADAKTPETRNVAVVVSSPVEASHSGATDRIQTVMTRRMHRLANTPEKADNGEKENAADAKTPETRNVAVVVSSPVEASHSGATDRIQTVMTRRMHRLANTPEKADNGEKENAADAKTPETQDVAVAVAASGSRDIMKRTQMGTRRMHRLANTPEMAASGEKENAADAKTPEAQDVAVAVAASGSRDVMKRTQMGTRRMHRLASTPKMADDGEKENAANAKTSSTRSSRSKTVTPKNLMQAVTACVDRSLKEFDLNVMVDVIVTPKRASARNRKSVL